MLPSTAFSQQLYAAKAKSYFEHARRDMAAMVVGQGLRVLDVGCGTGGTGALLKADGKAQRIVGDVAANWLPG